AGGKEGFMRGVFSRLVAVCLLVVLLAPVASASGTTVDVSLWDEFMSWCQSRLDIPGGFTAVGEDLFVIWLMSRLDIPGG
ncbi:MAG TPA: hypothetical protein VF266_02205, partial [Thermoanaerobaculia bacterium]